MGELEQLQPFGTGNPSRPSRGIRLRNRPDVFKEQHFCSWREGRHRSAHQRRGLKLADRLPPVGAPGDGCPAQFNPLHGCRTPRSSCADWRMGWAARRLAAGCGGRSLALPFAGNRLSGRGAGLVPRPVPHAFESPEALQRSCRYSSLLRCCSAALGLLTPEDIQSEFLAGALGVTRIPVDRGEP